MNQRSSSWLIALLFPLLIGFGFGLFDSGSSFSSSLLFGLAVGSIWLVQAPHHGSFFLAGLSFSYLLMGASPIVLLFAPLGLLLVDALERFIDTYWSTPLIGGFIYITIVWLLGLFQGGLPAVLDTHFIGSLVMALIFIMVINLIINRQTSALSGR